MQALSLERLQRITDEQLGAVFVDSSGELWSARKVFRRYIEHEREHTHHIQEILEYSTLKPRGESLKMDVMEAILTRRSIRKYTGEPVSEEDLQTILRAGSYAPSAHNYQPWHFHRRAGWKSSPQLPTVTVMPKCCPRQGVGLWSPVINRCRRSWAFWWRIVQLPFKIYCWPRTGWFGNGMVWSLSGPAFDQSSLSRPEATSNIVPVGLVALGHKIEDRKVGERFDPSKVHYESW
jgi:hypothetical protein